MRPILVIGGYGGFGGRLARRLAAAGHRLIVAGRSGDKAARFCAGLAGAEPLALDRRSDLGSLLAARRPALVIDAAGPFQSSGYGVPEACIAAGIPYLDLADARDFVSGIGALDADARAAGVAVVSGASSLPALSGAVVRRLAEGFECVHSVEIALSAANRAGSGASVVRAALSYAGRPVRLWRGGRFAQAYGWQELRREDFALGDGTALRGRLVAIADVPDLDILPSMLPGRPSVVFRAGTELGFQMRALWLASWPVRWGWLGSLDRADRWLLPLHRLTGRIGGERSAMSVRMKGRAGGRGVERCWTLIADRGEGLEVPTLAAERLAGQIVAGRLPPGACDASALLTLDDFAPAFADLAICQETAERALPPPLYRRLLGDAWDRLPPAVRALHDLCGDSGAEGEGRVVRGKSLIARMLAALMRFPKEGSGPVHVAFTERDGRERWVRDFGGHVFASELSEGKDGVIERFGPLRFRFDLTADETGLTMHLRRWSAFGLLLPLALAPRIQAREWEEDGRFCFDVCASLPLAGDVVHYSGALTPVLKEERQ